MVNPKSLVSLLTALLCAASIAGCGLISSSTRIKAQISASEQVNPDQSGRPSPIVVRIYELKALDAFEAAGFNLLFDDPQAQLGADLVAKESFYLRPGESRFYEREPSLETKYLAVTAGYRNLNRTVWKESMAIPPDETTEILILVDRLVVSMRRK